jgi:hypothetical protein
MADRASLGARLRHLRQQLDPFGVHRKGDHRSWDELVDLYDSAVEEAATATGIAVPDAPTSTGRRLTREAREQIEVALGARGIRVR